MLLAKDFRPMSPPATVQRRRPAAAPPAMWSPGAVVPAAVAIAGDGRIGVSGGGGGLGVGGFSSHDSEHDLALMVNDFWENDSCGSESRGSSDSDSGLGDLGHLAERLAPYKRGDKQESDLLVIVHTFLISIHETELYSIKVGQCNGSCIRHLLVKLLRYAHYDAAVCTSTWQCYDKVPGGDHEYIDVIVRSDGEDSERMIIDIDFRSHFEIARAVESYDALLNSLPVVYVGTLPRLKQFLQVMADAAKYSLKQNCMPLPPWRSLAYLQAKWDSKYERHCLSQGMSGAMSLSSDQLQCIGYLRRLKSALQSEVDMEILLKPALSEKKGRSKVERRRPSLLSS